MNIEPIFYLEHLTDEEITTYECSDRIWLPKREFEKQLEQTQPGIVSIIKLTNAVEQSVVGSPYSRHYNTSENTIYVPSWMYKCLDGDTTEITLTRVEPGLCTKLTVQPYTSEHLRCDDPLEALRDAFEKYTCIQSGTTIPLLIGNSTVQVDINLTEPLNDVPLCIRNGTLDLELLRPLDYPATPPMTPRPSTPIPPPPVILAPEPQQQPTREERRERAAAAAMARMAATRP